jgi:cell division protein FtsB
VRIRLSRRLAIPLAAIICSALLLTLFVGRELRIAEKRRHLAELASAQAVASEEQTDLRERLAAADDPSIIEDVARDRLGLVMPGEEKVIFVQEQEP